MEDTMTHLNFATDSLIVVTVSGVAIVFPLTKQQKNC